MAQVITRCRLTGHYMFMGMDADPKEFKQSSTSGTKKIRNSSLPPPSLGPVSGRPADQRVTSSDR